MLTSRKHRYSSVKAIYSYVGCKKYNPTHKSNIWTDFGKCQMAKSFSSLWAKLDTLHMACAIKDGALTDYITEFQRLPQSQNIQLKGPSHNNLEGSPRAQKNSTNQDSNSNHMQPSRVKNHLPAAYLHLSQTHVRRTVSMSSEQIMSRSPSL